ncbi:MAG: hypothetical protein M1819_006313 [Sarea resinae]|nr:MAG: hypothetical protein M1819_006313 [Sarea resinae]
MTQDPALVFDANNGAPEATAGESGSPQPLSPVDPATALARFEFEPGRGNEGTKILMVEWQEDQAGVEARGDWHVSWEEKNTVLPAKDQTKEDTHRLYFLLPPGVSVPPNILLTRSSAHGSDGPEAKQPALKVNPLPAIFPPELGASARAAGKKGVLHTRWAKQRLAVLQSEIDEELQNNIEGIGLEMALQEKDWIEENFGVTARPSLVTLPSSPIGTMTYPNSPSEPLSPRTPGGGRLMEKLKGLRIGTSEKELVGKSDAQISTLAVGSPDPALPSVDPLESNPLSPEQSDVAISSFASFHGNEPRRSMAPASLVEPPAVQAQPTQAQPTPQQPRRFQAAAPDSIPSPHHHPDRHQTNSLASILAGDPTEPSVPAFKPTHETHPSEARDHEDELFAKAISPRSPEMTKSPFSFDTRETVPWLRGEQ